MQPYRIFCLIGSIPRLKDWQCRGRTIKSVVVNNRFFRVLQPRRATWWTTWIGGSRLRAGRGGQHGCAPCRRGWRRWRCGRSCWTARSTTSARRPWTTALPRRRPRAPSPASSPGAPRNEAAWLATLRLDVWGRYRFGWVLGSSARSRWSAVTVVFVWTSWRVGASYFAVKACI